MGSLSQEFYGNSLIGSVSPTIVRFSVLNLINNLNILMRWLHNASIGISLLLPHTLTDKSLQMAMLQSVMKFRVKTISIEPKSTIAVVHMVSLKHNQLSLRNQRKYTTIYVLLHLNCLIIS